MQGQALDAAARGSGLLVSLSATTLVVSGLGVARAAGRPGLLAPGRSEFCMPSCNTRMGLACEEAKEQAGLSGQARAVRASWGACRPQEKRGRCRGCRSEERWLWLGAFMAQAAG
ncbi:unnamed protein product [Symbiodinium natans]|uniref:Uncharacterized protein n=1 Tax=Symbiodinium natans TaxID=878477 RepID=A0A812UGR0_9DINO|nr:unnamed protein product [Symbiodinium natans]